MTRIFLMACMVWAATLCVSFRVYAQPVLSGTLEEQFASPVNVSGVILVGLARGVGSGPVNLDRVRARLPAQAEAGAVCFNATTRDGQYWARGRLTAPAGPAATFQVSRTWRFRDALSRYAEDDIAFRLRPGADCGQAQAALIIPVVLGGADSSLTAQVNAGNALAVTAQLRFGESVVSGRCSAKRGQRSTAFTHACVFALPQLAAWTEGALTITRLLESGTNRATTFPVLLPASSAP